MPRFPITEEVCKQAEALAGQGLTIKQIARALGIHYDTLYVKKRDNPELDLAIKTGRAKGIASVSNALFQNAMQGNVTAQIFYLKNRAPDEWKDRQEVNVDHRVKLTREQMEDRLRDIGVNPDELRIGA